MTEPKPYIPYKNLDAIKSDDDLAITGFDKVYFLENDDGSVYFEYSFIEETIHRRIREKDTIAVTVSKNGSIRGRGARSWRGLILRIYK